jgi:hypothetical protein
MIVFIGLIALVVLEILYFGYLIVSKIMEHIDKKRHEEYLNELIEEHNSLMNETITYDTAKRIHQIEHTLQYDNIIL